jgi:hypothetical protein
VAAPLKIENTAPRSGNITIARGARRQKPQTKTPEPSPLTPRLKGFIDRVVVPILVKSYIEKLQNEKSDAESGENTTSSAPMTEAQKLRFPDDSD